MTTVEFPGSTADMPERPVDEMRDYLAIGLLSGRRERITGGDSGSVGR